MSTINEIQDEIIEEFEDFTDWMDRYAYIIDLGNAVPPLDERYKTPDNIIEGCQSRVWLQADYTMIKQIRTYALAFKMKEQAAH